MSLLLATAQQTPWFTSGETRVFEQLFKPFGRKKLQDIDMKVIIQEEGLILSLTDCND
jgi:hypothetical protein